MLIKWLHHMHRMVTASRQDAVTITPECRRHPKTLNNNQLYQVRKILKTIRYKHMIDNNL